MLTKSEKLTEVVVEEIQEIKCDVCDKNILKGKKDEDEASFAVLMFVKSSAGAIRESGIQDSTERESTDLCKACYDKIIDTMRTDGAKVPSYYDSDENVVDLFGFDDDEEEPN